jgi:Holliday junction DNA helicase RuvA
MIGRLQGELVDIDGTLALVNVNGVGYEVSLPQAVAAALGAPGDPVVLLTRQIVREDSLTLYGFLHPFQRRLFDLLLTVQGCGPKVALALLGQVGDEAVAGAVLGGDARALTRASGVGPKLAERIILELKAKMKEEGLARRAETHGTPTKPKGAGAALADELVDALLALGYRRSEAESAANEARESHETVQEQLRYALRRLQR